LIKKKKRKALQSHAMKCIFVGYAPGKKAWTFYNPQTRKFIESSHATFDERVFPGNTKTIINPFVDLSVPTSLTPTSPKLVLDSDTPDLHHRGGVQKSDSAAPSNNPTQTLSPLSPQLPAIETPFGSPLTSIPSLPSSRSPSPVPPTSPIRAPQEPKFGKDGLIIPEPNTGRGQRLRSKPSTKKPWNYHGDWPPPQPTSSELPPIELHIEPIPPVPSDAESSPHLSNEQILSGMSYVECGDDPELGYLTLSEAIDMAFRCHAEV
jgi:hypothetical protein